MNVRPVDDFKDRRRSLSPLMQVNVDETVHRMQSLSEQLCELPLDYQKFTVRLDVTMSLQFILFKPKNSLYVMFV